MNWAVVGAVFRRNFNGYFQSPIGYVFICAFVLMTGFAAFWPENFFNSNLASLHELNRHLPWILLVFIPAITMSVWADERRQGTEELLLTLPGDDVDVVAGKYLGALAIYTTALGFSLANIVILLGLGNPDLGVLAANYAGYWLAGGAMLGVGMMASFITNSLTVSFVLGLAFNAPLVFAEWAPAIVPWEGAARFLQSGSVASQLEDFGKGLITLSGVVYFASIAAASAYVSMILIGRRHWAGGPRATGMTGHYLVRAVAVACVLVGANTVAQRFDVRGDMSAGRVNSLSRHTKDILGGLKPAYPVYVEAYVSPTVPEEYVTARLNLLSALREIKSIGGERVVVKVHEAGPYSAEELQAQEVYGIEPMDVQTSAGGKFRMEKVLMGAAVTSGLDKVVIPFFDLGIPAEYELVRSIATVCQEKRKKVGVLETEAKLLGGFDMGTMSSRPEQAIVEELRKQYEVTAVSADREITEHFDVLLAVQPSSLTPEQMGHFVAKVRSGQATVIFEDPAPSFDSTVTPTEFPRVSPRQNPFSQPPPAEPKGDIGELWRVLGVHFNADSVVWQEWNPYPKLHELPREIVFIGKGSGATEPFDRGSAVSAGLRQVAMIFAGSVEALPATGMTFKPVLTTGNRTGVSEMFRRNVLGELEINPNRRQVLTERTYVMGAQISGRASAGTGSQTQPGAINVMLFCDIDMLYPVFFNMRARGSNPNDAVTVDVDNVPLLLNALDAMAGDDRFLGMRTHRPVHATLTAVESRLVEARTEAEREREKFVADFETKRDAEQVVFDRKIEELKSRKDLDPRQAIIELSQAQQTGQSRLDAQIAELERARDKEVQRIERQLNLKIQGIQNLYKVVAIVLPPILPLALAGYVWGRRRSVERVSIPSDRKAG